MRRRGDNAGMAGDDRRAQVQLDEDTLARRRRVLGEDHPDTLASASNLAFSLQGVRGQQQAARELAVRRVQSPRRHRPERRSRGNQTVSGPVLTLSSACAVGRRRRHHGSR